jgi:hypothetical protein
VRRAGVFLLTHGLALLALPAFAQSSAPDQYAPLDNNEWQQLSDDYRQLADCEDRYMTGAGINGDKLGQRLAKLGKVAEIRDTAIRLLDAQSPWRKSLVTSYPADPDVATKALMALMMDGNQADRTRTEALTRTGYARYYTSLATDGQCKASDRFVTLLKKSAG